jgi:diacylglycerol kinase family enzyme
VVTIGDVTKLDFLTTAPKLYSGRYLSHPKVELLRSSSAAISAAEQLPLEVDGEPVGMTPARFEVVPSAVRLRVPAT